MRTFILAVCGLTLFAGGNAWADNPRALHIPEEHDGAQRTLLTLDNQFPKTGM